MSNVIQTKEVELSTEIKEKGSEILKADLHVLLHI
jgi:hypothetical protein